MWLISYCHEKFEMSVKPMAGFDMENRDPNNLNEHLQVKMIISMIKILLSIKLMSFICVTIHLITPFLTVTKHCQK